MSELLITPEKSNGHDGAVSALRLAQLRKKPPDEAAKALADIVANKQTIKPSKQQLALLGGVSVGRINTALNGSRPRHPKPSPKTVADLAALLGEAEAVVNSTRWWNDAYRERELRVSGSVPMVAIAVAA